MRFVKRIDVIVLCVGTLLTSCASYRATDLSALDPAYVNKLEDTEGLTVGCKEFSRRDCETYLDRDVRRKGYHAVQITFQNSSEKSYKFSTNDISLPCASSEDVAAMVHTSTFGRVMGYGLGSLVFAPLLIPAIVDGIKSSAANAALDMDFARKSNGSFTIDPYSFKKTVVFIPHEDFASSFDVTLTDQATGELKKVRLRAAR
ncbi:MAG: hypothetical protein SNF33_01640 [Candidatus Algichlamydia australiensis]|nr:hypothetical protein [Chlamydiales bacterium]